MAGKLPFRHSSSSTPFVLCKLFNLQQSIVFATRNNGTRLYSLLPAQNWQHDPLSSGRDGPSY